MYYPLSTTMEGIMSDFIKLDTKELDKLLFFFRRKFPGITEKVIMEYVNKLAFETKKKTRSTMNREFKFSNNSTKKYTHRGVGVQKAKRSDKTPRSEVGALGQLHGNTRQSRKASYLARQELSGTVTQLKSKGVGLRDGLVAPNPRNNKKKMPRLSGTMIVAKRSGKPSKALGAAIWKARKSGRKFVSSRFGIYKILKRSAKLMWKYKKRGSIKTPKNPWLQPAVDITLRRKETLMKLEMRRAVNKIKGLR